MTRKRKRDRPPDRRPRAVRHRWVAWVSAGVCGLVLAAVVAVQFVPAGRPADQHPHPQAPHGGQVVVFGTAGAAHRHAEFVVEPTGVVRLYTLDEAAVRPLPVEAQPLVLTALAADGDGHPVMLRPDAEPGTPGGQTARFVGRLPAAAVGGPLRVRVTELKVQGDRLRFEFDWRSPLGEEGFRAAFAAEQRRIFLSPGGRYTAADIRANGGAAADAPFARVTPAHDHAPRAGDRVCPVSGFRAEPAFAWVVGGETYLFCCQPCVDEFVLLAKEKPDEVRPAARYVH